jgi:hypothetical protein
MRSPCCLCLRNPLVNVSMSEPMCMKLGMHIMTPDPISTAYFINPSHQSVCLYPLIITKQRLGGKVTAARNTRENRRTFRCIFFYAVCVISKEIRLLVLPRTDVTF